jgi:hypothetical protein
MEILNRNDIKNFILKIENAYPVDQWKVDDIDVWPILRIKLYLLLISAIEDSHNKQKSKAPLKVKESNSFITRVKTHRKTKRLKAKLKLNKLKKIDFLFGTANTQRSDYSNKSYNKFADPIMDEENNKSIVIEHSLKHLYPIDKLYKKKRIFFLYDFLDYTLYSERRIKRLSQKMNFHLPEYDNFISFLSSEKNISLKIDQFNIESLQKLMNRFHDFEDIYTEIIKRTQPKIVFSVCYYSFPAMVLNYVANKKNIKTIEIQHGPQSDVHLAYSSWSKLPINGYNTLPKVFWSWDKYSNKVIAAWANNKKQHYCFIGGNPWIDFLKTNQQLEKKIILYSLQNLNFDFLFPKYLIEAIKTTTNFKWWLRLHPRQLEYQNELIDFLKLNKIEHLVNLKEASNLPLPNILNQTKIHITNFSGCTLEAMHYGIPSIVIDKRGYDAFKDLIDEKKVFYSSSKEDFERLLPLLLKSSNTSENLKRNTYREVLKELD